MELLLKLGLFFAMVWVVDDILESKIEKIKNDLLTQREHQTFYILDVMNKHFDELKKILKQ